MKRTPVSVALLALGFLAASLPLSAESVEPSPSPSPSVAPSPEPSPAPSPSPAAEPSPPPPSSNWFDGDASLVLLGRDDVASSKFEEYRTVPKGFSMPVFTLQG